MTDNAGGVAIIIKNNIQHHLLPVPQTQTIESVAIYINSLEANLYAVYTPTQVLNKNDLYIISHNIPKLYMMGDLNAHNKHLTNSGKNNKNGIVLGK